MKRSWLVARLGIVGALGAMLTAFVGCDGGDPDPDTGPSVSAICDKMCECKGGCGASEKKDCVTEGEALEQRSKEGGCSDTWIEYKECLDENMTCTAGGPDPGSCGSFLEGLSACWGSTEDPCEELQAGINEAYEECGVASLDTPAAECTEARKQELGCRLTCLLESASCPAISGEDANGAAALEECLSSCEPAP